MGFDVGTPKSKVRPSMNVTPLVDVVLVLLIIFMVITPLMTNQMSVNVPIKPDEKETPPDSDEGEPQVVLTVDERGRAWINRDEIADEDLAAKLQRVFAARADQTLFFDAAGGLEYGRAIEILDIARGAGIMTIAVLTDPIIRN